VQSDEGRAGRSAAWGVLAVVFGGGAIYTAQLATSPDSGFPIWPTYILGAVAAIALYMCFATIWGWWPTSRSTRGQAADVVDRPETHGDRQPAAGEPTASTATVSSTTTVPPSPPPPPVRVRLKPELGMGTNRFRLGVLNRGDLGNFRVEVVDAHNQDGNWIGQRSWPVPWLDDGSVGSKQIPQFGKPLLDFAHFDFLGLQQDLEGTKWLNGNHWVFPSLRQPVMARYSAVRFWSELDKQHFVITVRVIRDDPPGYAETEFKIGNDGAEPYCRDLSEEPASGTPMPTDPRQLRDLAVHGRVQEPAVEEPAPETEPALTSAVTDRWFHTSDGGKVPVLMGLTHTGMWHPGYNGRQPQETPPSVKIGMLVACEPIGPGSSGTELRAKFLTFLNSSVVRDLIEELTTVEPGASWKNLAGHGPRTLEAALTASENPMEGVPVASALFLPPTAGEALYMRNGKAATLILYVEPRTADGQVPPASNLTTWARRFSLALAVPSTFADFLDSDLGLATSNDPPAQLGIWLQSPQPLTVMVDIGGLRVLPGSSPSNQFMGWTFADPDGKSAAGVARDLMIQLCEYELHLDDFERVLGEEPP
jgi:hypothetical protein